MREAKHFQRDGRGVFKCAVCDRNTRITHQDRSSPLCYECFECAGWENHVQDTGEVEVAQANVAQYVAVIEKKGGNMKKFYEQFSVLFPKGPVAAPAKVKAKKITKSKRRPVKLTEEQIKMVRELFKLPAARSATLDSVALLFATAKSVKIRF